MTDFVATRRHMVDGQVRTSDVTDLRVISAMLEVPRERFISQASAALAYLDLDVPVGGSRRLLRPMVFAKLIQAAEIEATDRLLDVGCAGGYSAAVLARVAGQVVALEQDAVLALRYDLAMALENAGESKQALDSFQQVYAVNIDYRDVADRIAELQKH